MSERHVRGSALPWHLLIAAAANLAACAGAGSGGKAPPSGSGGSNGSHCTTIACLPAVTTHITWAVEIDPPNIASAAVTQLPTVDLYGGGPLLTLPADVQSPVTATFTAPPTGAAPTSASVVLAVPSLIPGRPDLTFQAVAATTSTTATGASLNVPSHLLMRGGQVTLTLVPLPPADQQSPPYAFSVPLAATLGETIATGNFSINGKLLDAGAKPLSPPFVARAFQGEAQVQVSNAPLTQADGSFQLLVATADLVDPVTVQLTPQSPDNPWFVSSHIALSAPMPTPYPPFMLAAYTPPNSFSVFVKDADNNTVSGALVQAQTTVDTSLLGTTDFARSATTDSTGTASISILTGSATALLYAFVVVPPAGSSAATTCPAAPVHVGGGPVNGVPAPTTTTIMLQRRRQLVGTVTDGQGYPVANVAITATPDSSPVPSCPSAPAAPANTTTDANGSFSLFLDPGTYQLDYDPPAGSAAPRLTEYQVVVPAAGGGADAGTESISHPVALPVAAAVQGTVVAQDGMTLLPSATVRFFETRAAATDGGAPLPPLLRAQTVTDANGAFRVAVPLPN